MAPKIIFKSGTYWEATDSREVRICVARNTGRLNYNIMVWIDIYGAHFE